jgi:hypothetical protein
MTPQEIRSDSDVHVQGTRAPVSCVAGGEWQISRTGGSEPIWNADGSKLFFRNGAGFYSASFRSEDAAIISGIPEEMFADDYLSGPGSTPNYALSPDVQRFLVIDESSRPF